MIKTITLRNFILILQIFCFCPAFSIASNYISNGYTNQNSYNPGDTVDVCVNANGTFSNKKLYLYNVNNIIADSVTVNLYPQSISSSNLSAPWQLGFGYAPSFKYVIPRTLKSGIYNWEQKIYFIVKSLTKNADITIIYPSNTETAYNNAGGKCLYKSSSTNYVKADTVSFRRPLTATELSYFRMYSDPFMKWFDKQSGYSYQVICDLDMDDYSEIQNSKIICVVGHSEYWSRNARLNFDFFVNNGKHAVILSGNTMWWQVRYTPDKSRMICYKSYADPVPNRLLTTVNWTDAYLNFSVLKSIGVDWLHGAYPPSILSNIHGCAGYKIISSNSPILAGTNLNFNDTLSCKTREYDGTLFSRRFIQGHPVLDTTTLGFCKIELIGYDYGQKDLVSHPDTGYGTFIAFKKSATSGNIVNTASSQWCANTSANGYPGGFGGKDSSKIQKIILNTFNLLLTHANIFSSPISSSCFRQSSVCCDQQTPQIKIFPNPSSGILNIYHDNADTTAFNVSVLDVLGNKIYSDRIYSQVDLSESPNGIYFISIETPQGNLVKKILISK